jgi:hypothetical protein
MERGKEREGERGMEGGKARYKVRERREIDEGGGKEREGIMVVEVMKKKKEGGKER